MFQRIVALSSAIEGVVTPSRIQGVTPDRVAVRRWVLAHAEVFGILGILVIAGVAHGVNMLHFPYFETDEGTYMSQAWSFVTEGQLAPYTYWYDHAPLGWIQIALWAILTGGFYTFGSAVESGRVLMLVIQLTSTFLVYRIARNVTDSILAAAIASLTFSLCAYGIYYHRRVLLDNLATVWMLASLSLLLEKRLKLGRVWLSGVALGISILSKELTVFVMPCFAYLAFFRSHRAQRWFATAGWVLIVGSIVSGYFLMALLKGELFPTGTWLGGTNPHVSLLGTLLFQADRGRDAGLLSLQSGFWITARQWASVEPFLVVGGSACAILTLLAFRRNRAIALVGASTLALWAFLARGGIVIGFYLVPLLPMLALCDGIVIATVIRWGTAWLDSHGTRGLAVRAVVSTVVLATSVALLLPGYDNQQLGFHSDHLVLWNNVQADAQQQSLNWVLGHLPRSSRIIIDDYMWTDLHDPANGSPGYPYAHWHWKVDLDPAIRNGVFRGNWRNIDYVITTPQMISDVKTGHLTLVGKAIAHSTVIAHFDTGGWPIDVRKVTKSAS